VILWYCIGFSVVIVHSIRLPLTFIVDLVDTPILLLAFLIVQSCIIHISIVEQLLFPLTLINIIFLLPHPDRGLYHLVKLIQFLIERYLLLDYSLINVVLSMLLL
jgi:hypothetical protein